MRRNDLSDQRISTAMWLFLYLFCIMGAGTSVAFTGCLDREDDDEDKVCDWLDDHMDYWPKIFWGIILGASILLFIIFIVLIVMMVFTGGAAAGAMKSLSKFGLSPGPVTMFMYFVLTIVILIFSAMSLKATTSDDSEKGTRRIAYTMSCGLLAVFVFLFAKTFPYNLKAGCCNKHFRKVYGKTRACWVGTAQRFHTSGTFVCKFWNHWGLIFSAVFGAFTGFFIDHNDALAAAMGSILILTFLIAFVSAGYSSAPTPY